MGSLDRRLPTRGETPIDGDRFFVETPSASKYGRLFPGELFQTDPRSLEKLGAAMSRSASPRKPSGVPAGYTFLGQFITHDITFDPTSLRERETDLGSRVNFRTPALDLDSVYGRGPLTDPQYYQRVDSDLFQLALADEPDSTAPIPRLEFELQRTPAGLRAIIPDPRNDENLIVAQFHVAIQLFHNAVARGIRRGSLELRESIDREDPQARFQAARAIVLEHYHQIILTDFLPRILHPEVWSAVRGDGPALFRKMGSPVMPVEFSAAAFRYGHTTIREDYEYNEVFRTGSAFDGASSASLKDLFDLAGGTPFSGMRLPIPSDWVIDWRRFFDFGDSNGPSVNQAKAIGASLAETLRVLPIGAFAGPANLAAINLMRGNSIPLPSGQRIARELGYPRLTEGEIAKAGDDGATAAELGLHRETPLWYYILKESEIHQDGRRLGFVGSRIVAETMLGFLGLDDSSLSKPNYVFESPLKKENRNFFTMPDLLRFAGFVDPVGEALATGTAPQQ